MYYIIETTYAGPNQHDDDKIDVDRIEISTAPATANLTRETRLEGWCGTTNDWAMYAHGEYPTLEEARAAIAAKFGAVRGADHDPPEGEDVIEIYKRGGYTPLGRQGTAEWAYESMMADVGAATTDDQIDALMVEYEAAANSEGYTLASTLREDMREYRQELRDDVA